MLNKIRGYNFALLAQFMEVFGNIENVRKVMKKLESLYSQRQRPFRGVVLLCMALMMFLSGCNKATAPQFAFTDLTGKQINSEQFKGRVLMVNFWATSCTTCVAEMPAMIDTYNKYHAQGLDYVAIAMSYDSPNYVLNFTQSRQLPFIVALDIEGKLAKSFGDVSLTPTTFVIDKQGTILKKYVGAPTMSDLHQLIEQQLKT